MLPTAPGPHGTDIGRLLLALGRDPLEAMAGLLSRHGDIARFEIGGHSVFIARSPEAVRHVFVANQDNYRKSAQYELLRPVLGRGLLTSGGDHWRRQRSLVQPMFAKRHLAPFAEHMTAAAAGVLDSERARHRDGDEVEMTHLLSRLTLDVVGRALFGADLGGQTAKTVGRSLDTILSEVGVVGRSPITAVAAQLPRMNVETAFRARKRRWNRAVRATAEIDSIVTALIDERAGETATERRDLLSLLLDARDDNTGEAMSPTEIRDELMTFILAGHETTANALVWTLMLLSRHPEARERMLAEVDSVLGGRTPTADDVELLPWTHAVIQEAMRLYPPAWILEREAKAKDSIEGFHIPKGSTVIVPPYLVHRNPRVWSNPEGFDPRRFLPGADPERPRLAYLPFGAGRRVCVGQGFALMEASLLAAMILQRFTFDLVAGSTPRPEPSVTLRPKGGLLMTVHPR